VDNILSLQEPTVFIRVNAQTRKVASEGLFNQVKILLRVLALITTIAGIFGIKTYMDNPAALRSI
jgi:hypothetical protein